MKVAVPDKSVYQDPGKKVTLTLFKEGKPRLTAPGEKHTWPERLLPPSELLISAPAKKVVYIGGLGDSGMSLGRIDLYDFAGKKLVEIDLNKDIPDLEQLSKGMQEDMGNFPWIAGVALSADGSVASIDVCKALVVTVDLGKNSYAVTKR
ncbi:MAG: hypothetical protein ACAI38_06985 [Myxococcota bacterium]